MASTSGVQDAGKWRDADQYHPKHNMAPGSRGLVVRRDKEVTYRSQLSHFLSSMRCSRCRQACHLFFSWSLCAPLESV